MKKKIVVILGVMFVAVISIFAYKKIYGNNPIDRIDQAETSKENILNDGLISDLFTEDELSKLFNE